MNFNMISPIIESVLFLIIMIVLWKFENRIKELEKKD